MRKQAVQVLHTTEYGTPICMPQIERYRGKCQGEVYAAAACVVDRGKPVIGAGMDENGNACIYIIKMLGHKRSKALDDLVAYVGIRQAWDFLTQDCGAAYSAKSSRLIDTLDDLPL